MVLQYTKKVSNNIDNIVLVTFNCKCTHIFIVDFHGSRIYQFNERKNHVFHCDIIWLLWNVFAVLNFTNFLMLKNLTVRWLLVYELVMFLSRLHNRQLWSPGILPSPPPTLPKAQVVRGCLASKKAWLRGDSART